MKQLAPVVLALLADQARQQLMAWAAGPNGRTYKQMVLMSGGVLDRTHCAEIAGVAGSIQMTGLTPPVAGPLSRMIAAARTAATSCAAGIPAGAKAAISKGMDPGWQLVAVVGPDAAAILNP